jgi:peptide/nickel transport system permease protein
MGAMILRRLLIGVVVVWGAATAVFIVLHLLPGDPVAAKLQGAPASPEAIAQIRLDLGLDLPIWQQYLDFLGGALRGDLGTSFIQERPVGDMILEALPGTITLTASALTIGIVLGCLLGLLCALWPDSFVDTGIRSLTALFAAMPVFWTGVVLIVIFSFGLGLFPAIGGDGIPGLVLPSLALGLASAGVLARVARTALLEVANEPHHVMLRAKGMPRWRIVGLHASRSALLPVLAMAGLQLGEALAGAVVIETVFSRVGIGRVLVSGILNQDYPVVQGIMLLIAAGMVVVNLAVDLSQTLIDPRIRTGKLVAA